MHSVTTRMDHSHATAEQGSVGMGWYVMVSLCVVYLTTRGFIFSPRICDQLESKWSASLIDIKFLMLLQRYNVKHISLRIFNSLILDFPRNLLLVYHLKL